MSPRIGQRAPSFSLPDSEEKERKLSDFVNAGHVVIAFFPFAFSGVCDREACTFRDGLSRLGANIVGISVDSVYTLRVFAETYNLQFPLLSDFNKKVSRLYGVLDQVWVAWGYRGVAKRSVFVVDRKGVLRYKWVAEEPSVEPRYHDIRSAVNRLTG